MDSLYITVFNNNFELIKVSLNFIPEKIRIVLKSKNMRKAQFNVSNLIIKNHGKSEGY